MAGSSDQPGPAWEESRERAEVDRKTVRYLEVGRLAGVSEGQGQSGCAGCGRLQHRGVRERLAGEPLQDLEPDVLGQLFPAAGQGGGDTETAWRRDKSSRRADGRGQNRADGGGRAFGEAGGTGVPPGLLRLPA